MGRESKVGAASATKEIGAAGVRSKCKAVKKTGEAGQVCSGPLHGPTMEKLRKKKLSSRPSRRRRPCGVF